MLYRKYYTSLTTPRELHTILASLGSLDKGGAVCHSCHRDRAVFRSL